MLLLLPAVHAMQEESPHLSIAVSNTYRNPLLCSWRHPFCRASRGLQPSLDERLCPLIWLRSSGRHTILRESRRERGGQCSETSE